MSFIWLVSLLIILVGQFAQAQSDNLFDEEDMKDQEREIIIQDLQEQQRIEKEKIFEEITEDLSDEELEARQLVEVEVNNILPADGTNRREEALIPYNARKTKWGKLFSIHYVLLDPSSYDPEYATGDFSEAYGSDAGMIEASLDFKRNTSIGSLALQLGIGALSASADNDASISLIQSRLGAKLTLDSLFPEPYIAPYGGAGVYMTKYEESLVSDSVNGTTDPAFYFLFGGLFQLDWIDKSAATEAYIEGGIENTFLFLEARNYMSSDTAQDPDFSTEFSLAAGLSLEF